MGQESMDDSETGRIKTDGSSLDTVRLPVVGDGSIPELVSWTHPASSRDNRFHAIARLLHSSVVIWKSGTQQRRGVLVKRI